MSKKKSIILFFSILFIVSLITASTDITKRPEIKDDITTEEKDFMKEKYNAEGYKINNCWWKHNDYFCDIEIGSLHIKRFLITSNFDKDSILLELDSTCITEFVGKDNGFGGTFTEDNCYIDKGTKITMQELLESKLTTHIKAMNRQDKKKQVVNPLEDLTGVEKSWKEGIAKI